MILRDPATELLTASVNAEPLMVGAHHGGRVAQPLLGSVSRECPWYSRRPVLVITPEAAKQMEATPSAL